MDTLKIINRVRKIVTNGILIYISLTFIYIIFFFLLLYFKNIVPDSHIAYILTMGILTIINVNVMSIIFINKFNKIMHQISDLIYTLGYVNE